MPHRPSNLARSCPALAGDVVATSWPAVLAGAAAHRAAGFSLNMNNAPAGGREALPPEGAREGANEHPSRRENGRDGTPLDHTNGR